MTSSARRLPVPVAHGDVRPLVAAHVDDGRRQLVCGFQGGDVERVSLAALGLSKGPPVRLAAPDELKAGVVLRRLDGTEEDCSADFILALARPGPRPRRANRSDLARRVGQRLRALRKARGLTQREMARRLGLAPPNYARTEAGQHVPSVTLIVRIAGELGVPLDRLVAAK